MRFAILGKEREELVIVLLLLRDHFLRVQLRVVVGVPLYKDIVY